jgi:DNA-binding transcriptional regulator GbsR (MarR family)
MQSEDGTRDSIEQFIERLGLYFEEFGLPRIGGRLLGLLIVAERPLSLDEIARRLLVSRASVSTNARLVLATRLVERVGIPGDRRDYYTFSRDAWDAIIEVDLAGVTKLRDFSQDAVAGLADANDPARTRLADVIEFMDFYAEELNATLARWRARKRGAVQHTRQPHSA